jgi:hypothetical protein
MEGARAVVMGDSGFWPDLKYIRHHISVREIARELGLEVFGNSARCWRGESHQHGDQTPSLSFTKRNRWKCHVCDDRARSNLDLVMKFHGCDLKTAVEWIAARFDVPRVERNKSRRVTYPHGIRAGVGASPLDDLVRSGLWACMSSSARSVLGVFIGFKDPDTKAWIVEISMRGLSRFAGLSVKGVWLALHDLEHIGLVTVFSRPPSRGVVRACNKYELTFESPRFLEWSKLASDAFRTQVDFERAQRRMARETRSNITLGNTLLPKENSQGVGVLRGNTSTAQPQTGKEKICGLP